ncbi:hypothetical protein F4814DRAFT_419767 [Daldinia grandis]|nr:hypothetical protein F4814DRAFT_419767 [Daldinia grandis]
MSCGRYCFSALVGITVRLHPAQASGVFGKASTLFVTRFWLGILFLIAIEFVGGSPETWPGGMYLLNAIEYILYYREDGAGIRF